MADKTVKHALDIGRRHPVCLLDVEPIEPLWRKQIVQNRDGTDFSSAHGIENRSTSHWHDLDCGRVIVIGARAI